MALQAHFGTFEYEQNAEASATDIRSSRRWRSGLGRLLLAGLPAHKWMILMSKLDLNWRLWFHRARFSGVGGTSVPVAEAANLRGLPVPAAREIFPYSCRFPTLPFDYW